jgi:hypothetical protein
MLSLRMGLLVLGCVSVGFVASAGPGLAARAAEPELWKPSVMVPGGGDAQRRIAQLEQRLRELEAERRGAAQAGPSPVPVPVTVSAELEAVMARNEELVARNRTLATENQALVQGQVFERAPVASRCEPAPDGSDPKAQLRYWAERLRDGDNGFRGGLSPEQNAALNVLLRRERALDPRNPWYAAREPAPGH